MPSLRLMRMLADLNSNPQGCTTTRSLQSHGEAGRVESKRPGVTCRTLADFPACSRHPSLVLCCWRYSYRISLWISHGDAFPTCGDVEETKFQPLPSASISVFHVYGKEPSTCMNQQEEQHDRWYRACTPSGRLGFSGESRNLRKNFECIFRIIE